MPPLRQPIFSGQAELFATNTLLIPDMQKRNAGQGVRDEILDPPQPAHMGVRMGEHNLVRWLDEFIFFNTMNGRAGPAAPESGWV